MTVTFSSARSVDREGLAPPYTRTETIEFYVDGTLRTTGTQILDGDGSNHVISIGNMRDTNPFGGLIEDVKLVGCAVSASAF